MVSPPFLSFPLSSSSSFLSTLSLHTYYHLPFLYLSFTYSYLYNIHIYTHTYTMDSSTVGHSFPPHAPIRYAFTIVHLLSMSIAYLGFYPHALTQLTTSSPHKKQRLLISLGCAAFFTVVGLVAGWHVPTTTTTTITTASSSTILHLTGLNLILLVLTILDYTLERIGVGSSLHHQQHSQEEQPSTLSWLYSWVYHVPNKVHMVLKGITLCLGYFYLASSVLVLTLTCQSLDQCWLPLSMGLGFLLFGSLSFMHLVNIVTLPRHASPEYVEALWILFCGCLSMIWWSKFLFLGEQ